MGPIKKKRRLEKLNLKVEKALDFLCVTFPKCFIPRDSEEPVKPLAIGTDKEVLAAVQDKLPEKMTIFHIKGALHIYCNSLRYRQAISCAGAIRVNVAGEEAGCVTEEEVKGFLDARAARIKAAARELKKAAKMASEKTKEKMPKKVKAKKPAPPPPATKPKLKLSKSLFEIFLKQKKSINYMF